MTLGARVRSEGRVRLVGQMTYRSSLLLQLALLARPGARLQNFLKTRFDLQKIKKVDRETGGD